MVDTSTAPEWIDSDVCLRCRDPFTFTNRKHHCRNCGQVFDQRCSSKSIPLPHFGITQAVRVCEGCYSKLQKKAEKSDKGHRHSTSMYSPRHSSPRDLADAELQRAIELSLEEVGAAHGRRPGYVPAQPPAHNWQTSEPPLVDRKTHPDHKVVDEDDPDLRAAIEASLREVSAPKPSAPVEVTSTDSYNMYTPSQPDPPTIMPPPSVPNLASYDLEPLETDAILTFSQTVEQVQTQGGRDMSRYPAVNELFDKANTLRPKLAMSLDDTDRKEQLLAEMHDKLSQAVKLYDKLLTEQVSRPTWRRSPQQAHSAAAPMRQSTQTPVNGYSQWAPSHQHTSSVSSPVFAPLRTDSAQYAPQPLVSRPSLSTVPESEPQPQYAYYAAGPSQHPTALASPSAPPQPQQTPQFTSPPPPLSYLPPQTPASPPIPAHQPVSIPQFTTAPLTPSQPLVAQSPAPQPQLQPQSPTLARHHTVSARATMSSPPTHLTRSSTLSHAQRPQYQQPAQPHLPQMPSAPTTAPQPYELYAPSPPTTMPERREELLIEL